MKKLILITLALASLFISGCASRIIDAATTKLEVQNGKNKGFSIAFPKELQATKLDVSIDPKTGAITLKADQLKSSSTSIIESAGAAQAHALDNMSSMLSGIMPILLRAATGIDVPAVSEPAPAPVIPPVDPFVIPQIK